MPENQIPEGRMQVAIVGAGTLGCGWLVSFARGGCAVRWHDPDPAAMSRVARFLDDRLPALARHGLIDGEEDLRALIRPAASLEEAVAEAAHVQECVPERLDLKQAIFRTLDSLAKPSAVLASSTTGLPPSAFVEALAGRARCIAVHPLNPPYLHPAVEVTPSPWTSADCMARTRVLMEAIGQVPIMLRGEGRLVLTRLAGAILDEAFRLVEDGSASVEDVDKAMRDGLGLRYVFMGPFEVTDLNAPEGIGDFIRRYGPTFAAMREARGRDAGAWSAALCEKIEAERRALLHLAALDARMAWRDERLMEIAAFKHKITSRRD